MAHILYNTEGMIFGYQNVGEADRVISVFTKDFGKISVFAKGVRLQKSKLAPSLNLFSYSRIGFVAGKDIWRLTDAEEILSLSASGLNSYKFYSLGNIFSFLGRMVQGQEKDELLWGIIKSAFLFLADCEKGRLSSGKAGAFELLTKSRILDRLGYVALREEAGGSERKKYLNDVLSLNDYREETLKKAENCVSFLEAIVAKGVAASSL